jgi:intracellular multiplication protein IcmD
LNKLQSKTTDFKRLLVFVGCVALMAATGSLFAGTTLGNMASGVTGAFSSITKMVTGGCYIAGLAFSVTAILQFKQHKDNPTQVTIGKPIALVFIAAALLFMPSILSVAGYTMFGSSGGNVAGSTGTEFKGKI